MSRTARLTPSPNPVTVANRSDGSDRIVPAPAYPFLHAPAEEGEIGRLGNYRVLRVLGAGGMGTVFHAEDIALCRPVALKVMHADTGADPDNAWRRFLREARALAAIKHPNLVTVYQAGQDGDAVYLAMELLAGESLEARLMRPDPIDPAEVLRIGREIAAGLGAVHDNGLIHRDIKPANIWLEAPTGRVKILDFGLVRAVREETRLTEAGMVVGTPAFMSPEQIRGWTVDARSDLFSFGCVLYALCTGRVPFEADNVMAQLAALAADDPAPIRELNKNIPPALADLVAEMLDKKPNRRPASAAAVAERLRAIRKGMTTGGESRKTTRRVKAKRPESSARRLRGEMLLAWQPRSFARRHPGKIVAACLLAAVLGGVVGFAASRKGGSGKNEQGAGAPAANPAAKPTESVFLATLPKTETVNWPFHGPFLPPGLEGPVRLRGQAMPHSMYMHPAPPHERPASVTYNLDGKYTRFMGEVAFGDAAPQKIPPVSLFVYADGKRVWQSRVMTARSDTQAFDIPVVEVDVLKLEVVADDPRGAHAVWVDPVLTK